jgi:L-ornithine N5-oxygenase
VIDVMNHDVIGVGFGPSNLAFAIALREASRRLGAAPRARFLERQPAFAWHGEMLLPGTDMQIAFVKDLVSLRDPTSRFSFLNYLHEKKRLTAFLNLKTFNPSRIEFNDYLGWAAEAFAGEVSYGETVESIEPVVRDGRVAALLVEARDVEGRMRRRTARHLVVATGGSPFVPPPFAAVEDPRVLHSSRYLTGIAGALGGLAAPRISVVGGGQSAAEIAVDAGARYPEATIDLITRSHALRPADDSPFANEIFDPGSVDVVHRLGETRRATILGPLRNTNYAVVDADLIARFYAILYDERVRGAARHRFLRSTEAVAASADADGVKLTLRSLAGELEERRYDAVVLATGYERAGLPAILDPLKPFVAAEALERRYRLPLRSADVTVHVQGRSEATHGLSDTLLSVTAVRAGEITASIDEFDAALARRPSPRLVGA